MLSPTQAENGGDRCYLPRLEDDQPVHPARGGSQPKGGYDPSRTPQITEISVTVPFLSDTTNPFSLQKAELEEIGNDILDLYEDNKKEKPKGCTTLPAKSVTTKVAPPPQKPPPSNSAAPPKKPPPPKPPAPSGAPKPPPPPVVKNEGEGGGGTKRPHAEAEAATSPNDREKKVAKKEGPSTES